MRIETLSRIAFWLCVLIIIVLSLLPGTLRPHTAASGHLEHFIAYAGTGFLFAPGSNWRQRVIAVLGLAVLSGAAEIAQLSIPGRSAEIAGFAWSSAGAVFGLLAGAFAWRLWNAR